MHVITVTFEIDPARVEDFGAAMRAQAENSLEREPGCLRFDVCRDPADPARTFLYEIYTDEAAFRAHLESAHYLDFDAKVGPWVRSKSVDAWQLDGAT